MAKKFTFKLIRDTYTNGTTLGKLYAPDGTYICETLEDIVRGWGIKHGGTTAIPTTQGSSPYKMNISMSQRFKRRMVMIFTESNGYELKKNGISFKGIRIHGGNTNANTWGCVIVAARRLNNETIQGTQEAKVLALVEDYLNKGEVCLEVQNRPQAQ
jgi:hypothetical protein